MTDDWLLGSARAETARNRLVEIAGTLIAQRGVDKFDLNELAARSHCSRATVYRHTGGKQQLLEAVFVSTSTRLTHTVNAAVSDRTGLDRARTAIAVAVREMRSDRIARQFLRSRHVGQQALAASRSPALAEVAAALIGLDPADTITTSTAVRGVLALVLWPPADNADEPHLIEALAVGLLAARDARAH